MQASPIGVSFFNAKKADGSTIDMALFGISENSFLAPAGEAKRSLAGPPGIILSHEFEAEGCRWVTN